MSFTHFFNINNIFIHFGVFYVNGYPFVMMVWNVLLAMAPFPFFLLLSGYWKKTRFKKTGQKLWAVFLFALWFILLPNAAYLITDIRHLMNFCPAYSPSDVCVPGAWEIMFFFVYSILGWIVLVILLKQMKSLLAAIYNKKIAARSILVFIPLISLGVLLGLNERFNSWDVFIHPWLILWNLLRYFSVWGYFRNLVVFTAGFYLLYFLGDYLFKKKDF
ncbi:MAG TPA: DUF1361 domain-containing protein [Candidatus Methylomirabilis sp.]|nr:DUF1361 domain-containing protein [Candidatus Methylomirabilis sp.]